MQGRQLVVDLLQVLDPALMIGVQAGPFGLALRVEAIPTAGEASQQMLLNDLIGHGFLAQDISPVGLLQGLGVVEVDEKLFVSFGIHGHIP